MITAGVRSEGKTFTICFMDSKQVVLGSLVCNKRFYMLLLKYIPNITWLEEAEERVNLLEETKQQLSQCPQCEAFTLEVETKGVREGEISIETCTSEDCDYWASFP